MDASDYVDVAHRIGLRLLKTAVWSDSQCTWVVTAPDGQGTSIRRPGTGELYQGSGGIGLFLAELYRATGDPAVRATAAAALRHAAAHANTMDGGACGFHSGYVGIAHALVRFAVVTSEDEFMDLGRAALSPIARRSTSVPPFDVIIGAAGAIPSLLQFSRIFSRDDERRIAIELGDQLIERADKGISGWSWGAGNVAMTRNLTGMAHGAAGAGHALVELYAETGNPNYWYAAEQAFAYERGVFSATERNWPDFRSDELWKWTRSHAKVLELRQLLASGSSIAPELPRYPIAWCHGAPGIGLTRVHAHAITGDPKCRGDAEVAIATTAEHLSAGRHPNYSLCHGALGNCELLLMAGRAGFEGHLSRLVRDLADQAMERHELAGVPWPGGIINAGSDPSLLVGDAGIGHFYLRLADASVPSVLLVTTPGRAPINHVAVPPIALRDVDIDTHFAATRRSFARLLGGAFDIKSRTGNAAADALLAVRTTIAEATGGERTRLADAARVDLARYELSAEPIDRASEFLNALLWQACRAGAWKAGRFKLSRLCRIVETRWAWDEWQGQGEPRRRTVNVILYRRYGAVCARPLGGFASAVFRSIESPRALDEIVDALCDDDTDDPAKRRQWVARVGEQLRAACDAGIAMCEMAAVPAAITERRN